MTAIRGRHLMHIPGPTNIPERILQAIGRATIDHRGPEFQKISLEVLAGLKRIFRTSGPVLIFPTSGTGAWEAALMNTLSPGDTVLLFETGYFAAQWGTMTRNFGISVDLVETDWRHGVDPLVVEQRLGDDRDRSIKAVHVVHNETSTGVVSDIEAIRAAMDRAGHPALLVVDTISSLGSIDYRHEQWQVDVTIGASQKGLMLPPGLGFNAVSEKALKTAAANGSKRHFWDWEMMLAANEKGFYPSTPGTNLIFGLHEAIRMLEEEGLEEVFARHRRLGAAARRAVEVWGLEILCQDPAAYSDSLTAVLMPDDNGADALRGAILERFDVSLGNGLGRLSDRVFRIGHLGHLNEVGLVAALAGVEMGLALCGVAHVPGGVQAAMGVLGSDR